MIIGWLSAQFEERSRKFRKNPEKNRESSSLIQKKPDNWSKILLICISFEYNWNRPPSTRTCNNQWNWIGKRGRSQSWFEYRTDPIIAGHVTPVQVSARPIPQSNYVFFFLIFFFFYSFFSKFYCNILLTEGDDLIVTFFG